MTTSPDPSPVLTVDASTGIAVIELRRPAHRNALTDDDLRMLRAHVRQANATSGVRVLMLQARTEGQERPVFCAGYHFSGFDDAGHDADLFEQVADEIAAARPVTLAALAGSVYGGATDLVLACDLRIGRSGCEFRMPAGALGIHYYPSGLRRYVARMGLDLAKQAFLTAQALPFERLHELGVLTELSAPESFDEHARRLALRVAGLAPMAVQLLKQSLDEIAQGRAEDAVLRARAAQTRASADFAEGRAAFAQGRLPRFRGS